jgi:uncharacterized phiE125 gp8 family phage protein
MITKIITKPAVPAVTLNDIKEHLRIEPADTDHDARLTPYLDAAINEAENQTGRALITQTYDLIFNSWDEIGCTIFPFGNLQSVTSLKYNDEDGAEQTVSSDDYLVNGIDTDEGKIIFHSDSDFDYPVLYELDPITIRIICGYGDAATDVPLSIQSAIKLMVEEMNDGDNLKITIDRLLSQNRLWQLWQL